MPHQSPFLNLLQEKLINATARFEEATILVVVIDNNKLMRSAVC